MEEMNDGGQLDLEYDFYSETCPETETIVRSTMTQITPTRRMSLLRCCASSSMTCFIQVPFLDIRICARTNSPRPLIFDSPLLYFLTSDSFPTF
ncbi:hypothetical protein C1H46_035285 [Malus baccata]|uniref:Uncharacterized protein n=1 Tax=Malus baccata TaxID=106549 RepID=A0A540KY70_MALBA|nr:hypothetical protein C1H46_035285 [Malus baccata]